MVDCSKLIVIRTRYQDMASLILGVSTFVVNLLIAIYCWIRQTWFDVFVSKTNFYNLTQGRIAQQSDGVCERVYYDATTGQMSRCLSRSCSSTPTAPEPVWKRRGLFASIKLPDGGETINITDAFNEYAPYLNRDVGITCIELMMILAIRGVIEWRFVFLAYKQLLHATTDSSAVRNILFVINSELDEMMFTNQDVIAL